MNSEQALVKPVVKPVVLTIAGSDSAGMAGMQMDIRTQTAFAVHTACVISANTAQNSHEVLAINPVSLSVFKQQFEAALSLSPHVIKVGLVVTVDQLEVLSDLNPVNIPLVYDPVLKSSSGTDFSKTNFINKVKTKFLASCFLVTPNISEAQVLADTRIRTTADVEQAAQTILQLGAKAVYIKGGHLGGQFSQDYFCDAHRAFWLSSPRQAVVNSRGTGCAFASAVSAAVALGYSIYDAVVIAKMAINQGFRNGYACATQTGPISIDRFPDRQIDLPVLSKNLGKISDCNEDARAFPDCNTPELGLYPVVDSSQWLSRLLPTGISTAQLRIKDLTGAALATEIGKAIAVARNYNCRLFINDYWQIAIEQGAYGVHLGQEDLDDADIGAIFKAGLRLGISSHCHYEVAKAHRYKPSYIACGPIYHTNTKQMPWVPHGLKGLQYWRRTLDYPLVAIGGINQLRLHGVAATGVDGVAMITAITLADDPEQTSRDFMQILAQHSNAVAKSKHQGTEEKAGLKQTVCDD